MRWMCGCALAGLLVLVGCESKKNLDQSVDQLITVLQGGDNAAFRALAAEALVAQVPPPKLERFKKITARFGKLQSRSMNGINVQTGGLRTGTYTLVFDKGSVDLELSLTEGKLTAFKLTGDLVVKTEREVEEEQYATFKVATFQFLDAEKKPKSNIFKTGEVIHFTFDVYGVTIVAGEVKLKVRLQVFDAAGKQLADYPSFIDGAIKAEGTARVATIRGRLPSTKVPGTYKLQLTVTDVTSKQTLDYTQAVVLE
jgi:hypothetical protein